MSDQPETPGTLREATQNDLPALLSLAAERRAQLAQYEPEFWRTSPQAAELQQQAFTQLFSDPGMLALLHETAGAVDGYIVAVLMPPPPLFAVDGPVCSVEEMWVAGGSDWNGVGRSLLDAATQAAQASGARHMVMVGERKNEAAGALLASEGYGVVSQQWVRRM